MKRTIMKRTILLLFITMVLVASANAQVGATGKDLLGKCETALQTFNEPSVLIHGIPDVERMAQRNLDTGYCYGAVRAGWLFSGALFKVQKGNCRLNDSLNLQIIQEVKVFVKYAEGHRNTIGNDDETGIVMDSFSNAYCSKPR